MTLLPCEPQRIERTEKSNGLIEITFCSNPFCQKQAVHRHHIVRRSYGGAHDWVLIDGRMQPNICGLCLDCHEEITRNKAKISMTSAGWFTWDSDSAAGKLNPYPGTLVPDKPGDFSSSATLEPVVCPTCERPLPKPKIDTPNEPKRERRTWSITVPKDRREDGAEVLDVLLEEIRLEFSKRGLEYGEEGSVRYFVLATALGLFVQHASDVIGSC